MSRKTVSVLIAAYNAGQYISSALEGVSRQVFPNWEVVVVEDGSKDNTELTVNSFAAKNPRKRILYDNLGANRGVSAARNRAIELAHGNIVAFLDADDQWWPDHLTSLTHCIRGGHPVACTPITRWDGDNDRHLGDYVPTVWQQVNPCLGLIQNSFIETSSCVAISREMIEIVGRFDESLRIGEDRDYWFRAFESGGSLGCTEKVTCRYIKHRFSSMAKTLLVVQDTVKFYEKHRYTKAVSSLLIRRKLAEAMRNLGRLTKSKDATFARNTFLRAWKVWPLGLDLPLRALATSM